MKKMNKISEKKILKIVTFYYNWYKRYTFLRYKLSILFLKIKLFVLNNIILFKNIFKKH